MSSADHSGEDPKETIFSPPVTVLFSVSVLIKTTPPPRKKNNNRLCTLHHMPVRNYLLLQQIKKGTAKDQTKNEVGKETQMLSLHRRKSKLTERLPQQRTNAVSKASPGSTTQSKNRGVLTSGSTAVIS